MRPSSTTRIRSACRTVRQPVRDDQSSAVAQRLVEGALEGLLGLAVEVSRRLVEDDEPGALEQQPGDGEPLLLAAGEAVAAVTDDRVEAGGQRVDERPDLGDRSAATMSSSVAAGAA